MRERERARTHARVFVCASVCACVCMHACVCVVSMYVYTSIHQVPIWSFSSYAALEVRDIASVAPATDQGGTSQGFAFVCVCGCVCVFVYVCVFCVFQRQCQCVSRVCVCVCIDEHRGARTAAAEVDAAPAEEVEEEYGDDFEDADIESPSKVHTFAISPTDSPIHMSARERARRQACR